METQKTKLGDGANWPQGATWPTVVEWLRPIWDYMRLNQTLSRSDAIVAFGSNDLATARYAASLFHEGLGPIVVVSGGMAHQSDLLATGWERAEGQEFAEAVHNLGVPRRAIVTETKASNTSENFQLTRKLLEKREVFLRSALVVHKPYMERRTYATGRILWSDIAVSVTSVPCSLEQYLFFNSNPAAAINVMLGDLQRIRIYGDKGMLEPQVIPAEVWDNFGKLVHLGFDQHILNVIPGAGRD
jgi:uncharacterized SAM-binding protein YcdF (DUF218 family)